MPEPPSAVDTRTHLSDPKLMAVQFLQCYRAGLEASGGVQAKIQASRSLALLVDAGDGALAPWPGSELFWRQILSSVLGSGPAKDRLTQIRVCGILASWREQV